VTQPTLHHPPFHSKFGGMWIDRSDFAQELSRRLQSGRVPARLASAVRDFERNGVLVLEQAASQDELARFETAISTAFREGRAGLLCQDPGQSAVKPVTAGMKRKGARVVDCYAELPEALDLLSSARLSEFLDIIFDARPKLFQSLSFDMGSEQGLHQDTAYVVVDRPMEMVGCWIALEDVQLGSGELQYMIGSHRLPDFDFSGKKNWNIDADGMLSHDRWSRWLIEEGQSRGYPVVTFLARRGDILIWHADLVHGGAVIANPELSRKSLVGHFCPVSATPHFAKVVPARATTKTHRGISYCSWYYDLASRR
jgi:phytanoyl-CoA hydroxylase